MVSVGSIGVGGIVIGGGGVFAYRVGANVSFMLERNALCASRAFSI